MSWKSDIAKYLVGTNILLIDDSIPFQRLTAEILKKMGVESVVIASTLADGMQQLQYNKSDASTDPAIDLVLMDVNLPDGNGIQGCEFLSRHASTYDIPVVVITASPDSGIICQAINAGARDYLQKPLVADLLKIRLGMLLCIKSYGD